jgi:putative membrane protein
LAAAGRREAGEEIDMIAEADKQRVADAIRAAEATTTGEIFCVVARRSSRYPLVPLAWAAAFALLIPPWLILLTDEPAATIYLVQVVGFVVAAVAFSHPRLRHYLVPRPMQHERAHTTAMRQFWAQGLHKTARRTGVLIFASQAERYAEIVADAGINQKVAPEVWQAAMDVLLAGIKAGQPADGFVLAIAQCGAVLAQHFPRAAGEVKADELPDKLVEI